MRLNTRIALYMYAPVATIALILYFFWIFLSIMQYGDIVSFGGHLIIFFIYSVVQIPLIFIIPEYYIFEGDRIVVRSLMKVKKVVQISEIESIYWQNVTRRLSLRKLYYYIIDDHSSNTIQFSEYRASNSLDLMRIPIDKKSKAIIASIWPHEIKESHFPERR